MPKYKFKVAFPTEVVIEVDEFSQHRAQIAAEQQAHKDGWLRTKPPCCVQLYTEKTPSVKHEGELILKLASLVQASRQMDMKERYSVKRFKTLQKLQEKTAKYQELLMEMQTTLKQRRLELDGEVANVKAMQPG